MPSPNYLAVLVAAVVIFLLGGLWYSKLLFATKWMTLQGKTMEQIKEAGAGPTPGMFIQVFICGFLTAWVLGLLMKHAGITTVFGGVHLAVLAWLGFAGATSYGSYLFSSRPKALWAIDSLYNLVSMMVAGAILGAWQ